MRAGVAAGHPATAEAGVEILADGGSAGRRGGRRLPRVVRRRDGHDGPARRRPRDLPRRRDRRAAGTWTASSPCPASALRRAGRSCSSWRCRSVPSSCTTPSGPPRAAFPACRPGSSALAALRPPALGAPRASRRSRSPAPAWRCPRPTPPAWTMLAPVMTMNEGAAIYAPGARARGRRPPAPARARARARAARRRGADGRSTRGRWPRACSTSSTSAAASSRATDLAALRGDLVRARGRFDYAGHDAAEPSRHSGRSRSRSPAGRR